MILHKASIQGVGSLHLVKSSSYENSSLSRSNYQIKLTDNLFITYFMAMEYLRLITRCTLHRLQHLKKLALTMLLLYLLAFTLACGGNHGSSTSERPSPPGSPVAEAPDQTLLRWESNMTEYGQRLCNDLSSESPSNEQALASTYYDGIDVFLRIADYRHDDKWAKCAERAVAVYRDNYVFPNNGVIPAYWNFTHGLTRHYLRTGDQKSQQAVFLIAQNAAFSRENTPLSSTENNALSREVSYTIMTYLNAIRLGSQPSPRLLPMVDQAIGHLQQWLSDSSGTSPMKPFMVALTGQALIQYYEYKRDERIPSMLRTTLDAMWKRTWKANEGAFRYQEKSVNPDEEGSAPDLNLLIAPAYMWVGHHDNNDEFRSRAEQIFASGVQNSFLGNGKHFNQNYRWSFDFVSWRNG